MPGCTHGNVDGSWCTACKEALVNRALETEEGTQALYAAAKLPVPNPLKDTKMGRYTQFLLAAKLPFPDPFEALKRTDDTGEGDRA